MCTFGKIAAIYVPVLLLLVRECSQLRTLSDLVSQLKGAISARDRILSRKASLEDGVMPVHRFARPTGVGANCSQLRTLAFARYGVHPD